MEEEKSGKIENSCGENSCKKNIYDCAVPLFLAHKFNMDYKKLEKEIQESICNTKYHIICRGNYE